MKKQKRRRRRKNKKKAKDMDRNCNEREIERESDYQIRSGVVGGLNQKVSMKSFPFFMKANSNGGRTSLDSKEVSSNIYSRKVLFGT